MAKLSEKEEAELASIEAYFPNRPPPELRERRARLRFLRDLPEETFTRLVEAKRAQLAAIQEREELDAELRRLAPDDDEADLLWWLGEKVAAEAKGEVQS